MSWVKRSIGILCLLLIAAAAVCFHYYLPRHDVVLVSKDLPMRVKASSVGLAAEEYRAELVVESGWTGMAEADVSAALIADYRGTGGRSRLRFEDGDAELPPPRPAWAETPRRARAAERRPRW